MMDIGRSLLLRNFKAWNLSYETQSPAFDLPSKITTMRSHCENVRIPGLIAPLRTLNVVFKPSPEPKSVAMSVVRPSFRCYIEGGGNANEPQVYTSMCKVQMQAER
jgi:hypothetical protein